jgi:hypothetical protein
MSADIAEPKPLASALRGFLTGLAGLLYAFLIWTAVFYAIQLSSGGMTPYGWVVLLLPAVVTAVVFAIAFVIARRRTLAAFVLVLLAGVGLSAVFLLNTFSFVIRNLASLTGS